MVWLSMTEKMLTSTCSFTVVSIVPGWLHHPVVPSYLLEVDPQGVSAALLLARIAVDLGASASPLPWLSHPQYYVNPVFVSIGNGYRFRVHFTGRARHSESVVGAGSSQPSPHQVAHVELDPAPLDFCLVSVQPRLVSVGHVVVSVELGDDECVVSVRRRVL